MHACKPYMKHCCSWWHLIWSFS